MTRMIPAAIVAVSSVVIAHPALSQSPAAAPPLAAQSAPAFVGPGDKPFQGIFPSPAPQPRVQATAKPELRRSVVCGMTVIQVDPKVDAGMLMQPKPGQTAVPKARIIEPKICR